MALKAQLYQWFSSRKKPTAIQFKALIDSFWSKDEDQIQISNVNGLQEALNTIPSSGPLNQILPVLIGPGVASWQVPQGTIIEFFLIAEPDSISFGVGLSPGQTQWIDPIQLQPGGDLVESKRFFPTAATIYFSGINPTTLIKIYKR